MEKAWSTYTLWEQIRYITDQIIYALDKSILVILSLALLWGFSSLNKWFKQKTAAAKTETERSQLIQLGVMLYAAYGFVFLLFFNGTIIYYVSDQNFLYDMSVSLIVSWVVVLIGYYAWALYFYNINYGWTDEDWKRNDHALATDPSRAEKAPEKNPFYDQTLGLPSGTVRGTIALTLLVCGVSFVIAALNMKNSVAENTILVDNFEFFKKAFLMMIAFYFGTKSLEILQSGNKTAGTEKTGAQNEAVASTSALPPSSPDAGGSPSSPPPPPPSPSAIADNMVTEEDLQKAFAVQGAKG